ncbi:hypothetical protein WI372_15450 [Gemmatimonadota bacterium DH-20]|uniref:HAMP domain-containing histidine kinase n=1 Tax=Gaopeijia maritima TaxID=3119007 RepID=A0ABU9EE82_9BACT
MHDAAEAVTRAVERCRDGLWPDFLAETRAPLATLVGAWRREGLPEHDFIDALAALGDGIVDRLSDDDGDPVARARGAAAVLDATQLLIRRSQRTFRSWRDRSQADEAFSVAVFGEALGHEIRNRIHAARTALELLRRPGSLGSDDRDRLQGLLHEAVVAARRAVLDVRLVTAEDPRREVAVNASLHELLRRTIDRHRIVAEEAGIQIEVDGPVASAPVDARRVQVILNNMLDVATRLLGSAGGTVLRVRSSRPDGGAHVEVSVDGDRPFLEAGHEEVLFEADLVDLADPGTPAQPAHLGLWLTREAAAKLGGDLLVVRDDEDAADALIARIPVGQHRDPSS